MTVEEWEKTIPEDIKNHLLWKMQAYRLALFISDLGWHDSTKLLKDSRTKKIADQLYRALGSISANLAEGYSRSSGKDRARFHEMALGSALESKEWYLRTRFILDEAVIAHRLGLLTQITKLLNVTITHERGIIFREESQTYDADSSTNNQ